MDHLVAASIWAGQSTAPQREPEYWPLPLVATGYLQTVSPIGRLMSLVPSRQLMTSALYSDSTALIGWPR